MKKKSIVPSKNLLDSMSQAEAILKSGNSDSFLIYYKLRNELKKLNPSEKELLSHYIAKRCVGNSIERSMQLVNLATAGLKIVENGIGKVVQFVIVDPSIYLYENSSYVKNASDWVLERASQTVDWFERSTPNIVVNQWTKLVQVIQSARLDYNQATTKLAKLLDEEFYVSQDLTKQTFQESIPFLSEQAVLIFGTKGVTRINSFGRSATKASSVRVTGAYSEGVLAGEGFGKLTERSIRVTQPGLEIVKRHISKVHSEWGIFEPNLRMIERLESLLKNGGRLSKSDASFYMHEVREATFVTKYMNEGKSFIDAQSLAHTKALETYRVSPFSVYHPEVISELPDFFNSKWAKFAAKHTE